jgi:hypothetical protein
MAVSIFPVISPEDWDEPAWDDAVQILKKYHVKKYILCPEHWRNYSNVKLIWRKVKFNAKGIAKLPNDKSGLYSFLVQPIGETTKQSLRERCADYLPEAKKKKARVPIRSMVRKWSDHLWLYFAAVDDKDLIKKLEEDLIEAYIPPFNQRFTAHVGTAGKLEDLLKEVFQ